MHISFVQNLKRMHISIDTDYKYTNTVIINIEPAIKLFVYKRMFNFVLIILLYAL